MLCLYVWRVAMPGITYAKVDEYMLSILPPRDSVMQEMEAEAAKRDIPIVGPAVGRVLFQYARLINAKKVFELGSAIGYSTLWFARAVGEGGEVFYTDSDPKNADEASGYFRRAGVAERIHVGVGDALEQLALRQREFDIIFNDVDKEYYPRVLDLVPKPSAQRRPVHYRQRFVVWPGDAGDSKDERYARYPGIQSAPVCNEGFLYHDPAIERRISGGGESLRVAIYGQVKGPNAVAPRVSAFVLG